MGARKPEQVSAFFTPERVDGWRQPYHHSIPEARRGNIAGEAPASRNAGALLNKLPSRGVGTIENVSAFFTPDITVHWVE